jgi:hypothetical protein
MQARSEGEAMRKRSLIVVVIAVVIVAVAIVGFTTIRRGFSARDNPSAIETYVAKTARRLSVLPRTTRSSMKSTQFQFVEGRDEVTRTRQRRQVRHVCFLLGCAEPLPFSDEPMHNNRH